MSKYRISRLFCALACLALPLSGFAISIGDYKPSSSTSGQIELTELEGVSYIDVEVLIGGEHINYMLKKVNSDLVLIKLNNAVLANDDVLIDVRAKSEIRESSRLYVHNGNTSKNSYELKSTEEVVEENTQKNELPVARVIIAPLEQFYAELNSDSKHGESETEVAIGQDVNSAGFALKKLASEEGLEVLILPGDEYLHNLIVPQTVSSFEDLNDLTQGQIKQVFIDHKKGFVRIFDTEPPMTFEIPGRSAIASD